MIQAAFKRLNTNSPAVENKRFLQRVQPYPLCKNARGQRLLWDILSQSYHAIIQTFRVEWPGSAGGRLDNQNRAAPSGLWPYRAENRPIFKDGFLRNVIVSICFLVFSSKTLRFRVPNKS